LKGETVDEEPDEAAVRILAIILANRFNGVLPVDTQERVVVRAIGYMLANNALGSGMTREQLVDLMTKVVESALSGYDLELTTRGNRSLN
jgi:hypothetical protein